MTQTRKLLIALLAGLAMFFGCAVTLESRSGAQSGEFLFFAFFSPLGWSSLLGIVIFVYALLAYREKKRKN